MLSVCRRVKLHARLLAKICNSEAVYLTDIAIRIIVSIYEELLNEEYTSVVLIGGGVFPSLLVGGGFAYYLRFFESWIRFI